MKEVEGMGPEGKRYLKDKLQGKKYEGELNNGEIIGTGKSYYENGNLQYEGEWIYGNPNKTGKYYLENGKLEYEGEYKE